MPDSLTYAVNDLTTILESSTPTRENVYRLAQAINLTGQTADRAEREQAIRQMTPYIIEADAMTSAIVAVLCGALIEIEADPLLAFEPVMTRVEDLIALAIPMADVCRASHITSLNLTRPPVPESPAGQVLQRIATQMPDSLNAWQALGVICRAAVAILSRSKQARHTTRANQPLRNGIDHIGSLHDSMVWLGEVLSVLDDEELIVLHPGQKRGYRIIISGIADNFQLHVLLADSLIGNPTDGWLEGVSLIDPHVAAALRDGSLDDSTTVNGVFNMVNWSGLSANGNISTAKGDHEHWIWGEGTPNDIRKFDDIRIILLGPPPYERAWNVVKRYPGMTGELDVLEHLSQTAVNDWLNRIAQASR